MKKKAEDERDVTSELIVGDAWIELRDTHNTALKGVDGSYYARVTHNHFVVRRWRLWVEPTHWALFCYHKDKMHPIFYRGYRLHFDGKRLFLDTSHSLFGPFHWIDKGSLELGLDDERTDLGWPAFILRAIGSQYICEKESFNE